MWVGVCFNRVSMFSHRPSARRTTISGINSGRRPSLMCRTCLLLYQLPRSGCSGRMYRLIQPRCATKRLRSLSRLWKTAVAHNKIKIQVSAYFFIPPDYPNQIVILLFITLLFYFFWLHLPVLNCSRLLTRVLPYVFEEPDWENIFWSSLPAGKGDPPIPLAHSLCSALCVCNPTVKFSVL